MISVRKALVFATAFSACSVVHAVPIPINDGTLEYEGALFTLAAQGSGTHYTISYWADFTNFTNAVAQPYFYALDWKWGDGKITSLSLSSAPDGASNWSYSTNKKVNNSQNTLNCSDQGGGDGAVCAQSNGNGIDIAKAIQDNSAIFSWVFDVNFESAINIDKVVGNTLRGGYIGSDGKKAGAIMSCTTGVTDSICSSYTPPNDPPKDPPETSVPIPGTLALLGLGLVNLSWRRLRRT